jgi:hypothetical protein
MADLAADIVKYRERVSKMPHINGKDLAIGYFFPLIAKLWNEMANMGRSIDGNFDDVYKALGVDADYFVLRNAQDLLVQMGTFLDQVMLAAGFAQQTPEGFGPTDKIPDVIRIQYLEIPHKLVSVLEGLQAAMESDDADGDEEDDEYDDDEDGSEIDSSEDESFEGEPTVTDSAVTTETGEKEALKGIEESEGVAQENKESEVVEPEIVTPEDDSASGIEQGA